MAQVKRICPLCGAANPLEEDSCLQCGADIERHLPAIRESQLPVPWKEVGASLALGVTALALRAGVQLVRALLPKRGAGPSLPGRAPSLLRRLQRQPPRPAQAEEARASQPQVRVWGRRAWGVWRSDGTSQWEVQEVFWEGTGRGR